MDIPLPQDPEPVSLIPTPDCIPFLKSQPSSSETITMPPLPSAKPADLLYSNIPMPDESVKIKTSKPQKSEESNRYSPSILSEDDPPVNHSNTTNRFLVLGKEKAKKRLLAFSAAKQAGNSVLIFNVKKPPVKQNAAKGFEQSTEDDQKLNEVAVVKKKTPTKKAFKEDKARAVISAIEEIKREELLMRGAFRFGIQPKSSGPGDMTAPIPLLGQPLNINNDLSDRQKGAISDLIDNLLSSTDKEKRREERRNERSGRKKSQRRTRSRERRRSRSKPKERDTSKPKVKENEKDVKLPQSWTEFRASGIDFERFRRSGAELESKKGGGSKKQPVLYEKELCNPLDYPARLRVTFKATGVRHVDREYSQDAIRYTKTKPSVAYCTNPGIESTRYRTRGEIFTHAKPASWCIMKPFLEATKNMCEHIEDVKETDTSRAWYSQTNYLNLSESDLNHKMDSLDVQLESKGAVEVVGDDKINTIIEQKVTDVVSVMEASFEPADSLTGSNNIVSSKWDSDCEVDSENIIECEAVNLVSIKTEKYEELSTISNYLLDVPHNGDGGREKEVESPDQSGLLVTLSSSTGTDSNPNLKNEYEEFLRSVTTEEGAEELVCKEEKSSVVENEKSGSDTSDDEETEAVVHREKMLQSSKKKSNNTKSKTVRKKSTSRSNREKKKKRNQKEQKKRRKKRKRQCSTSSSSSSSSEDSDDVVDKIIDQSKKSKKKKKIKSRKRKQKSKKKSTKKRRKEYSSSEDDSSSSSESSSESESDSSSSDSNSSSSSDNKRRRRKKSLKSRKHKLVSSKKKQKKEVMVASPEVMKPTKKGDKVGKTAGSRNVEEMMDKDDSCEPKVDVQTTVPLDAMSKRKLNAVKVQPDFHLEEDEEDEEIFRKSDKKKRKHSKSVSPIVKKQRRSPSTSPDSSSVSRPGAGSSDCTGIQYLHDTTSNTGNNKSSVSNDKGISGAEDSIDKLAINGVMNINEDNPVDQRRDIMWENDSPQVEGDEWENSLSWFKLHKQPVKSPLRFANLKGGNSTLSDDLNQEVAKRSLRELKYLREVIKSEVGIDSHSDIELEKDTIISNTASKCSIASEPLLIVNKDTFVPKLLEVSLEDTIEPKSEVSDLYSPGQEYDEKSNCTEHSDTLLLDQHACISEVIKISPNCRESDMSLDSNTCENNFGIVPSLSSSPNVTSLCFPYNTIPLPPQSKKPMVEPSENTSTCSSSKIILDELSVFEKSPKKTSPVVSKAKHIITVKLLPSAVRIQSQPVQSPDVKIELPCTESKTLWKAIGSPTCPVEPINISVVKPLILPKKVSRWSDVPISEITPTIPFTTVIKSEANEYDGTLNPNLNFTNIITEQECNTLETKDVSPITVNTNLIVVECVNSSKEDDKKRDEAIQKEPIQEKDDNKDMLSKDRDTKMTSSKDKDVMDEKGVGNLDRKDDKYRSNRSSRDDRDSKRTDRDDKWGYGRDDNGRRKSYDRVKRSPSGDKRRERSPSGDKRRERSPSGDKRRERSPSGDKRRERSPSGDKRRERSPSGDKRREMSPIGEKRRDRSPIGDKRRERSPIGDKRRERSPIGDKRRERSPIGDKRRERSSSRDKRRERSPSRDKRRERSPIGVKRREKSPADKQRGESPIERCHGRSPVNDKRRERTPIDKRKEGSQGGDWRNEKSPNVDKRRGRSPGDRRKERSPRRGRSPSEKRRDGWKRSPNRSRLQHSIESRDNLSQHDRRCGQREYYKSKCHETSNRHQLSPLENIPLPLIQSHVKDDCMSMDMEFSSPLSSPLVGLKRSLADSTTRSDEELKSVDSNQMLQSGVSSQHDPVITNLVQAEMDTNVSSPFSPKRLSLDERLERELGVDLGLSSPPTKAPPGPVALTPIPRDPNYHPYWPYQNNFSVPVESGSLKRPGLLPTPLSEKYLGAQSNQLISGTAHPNNYYIQPQGPNYIATVNGPHMQAMISEKNYLPRIPLAQTYPGAPIKPLQPILIPDSNFVVPSLSRPPLPVPRPPCGRESPSNALIANSLPRIFHIHNSINHITPVSLISPPPLLASPQEYVCQSGGVAVPETDMHMVRNFYPDVPIFNEFGRDVMKESFVSPQMQYAPHLAAELTPQLRGVYMKPKSPVLLTDAEKLILKKKAARDLLKRDKELRRKEIEKERILKMKKFAKYKETLQQEGDTLRRSVTLNLEEIRLTGSLSPTRHTPVLNSRPRIPAVHLKPLTNVPATKGILVSIGFREKSSTGETRKSVMFADGVRPGEGTSPSAGEDPISPPQFVVKEKRLHKKKKKIKVHVIRQLEKEKGVAMVDAGNSDNDGSGDINSDNLPPPPPPPGSPPLFLKPYAFPGPQPGKMFPRIEMVSSNLTQESVHEPCDPSESSWVNVISSPVPMDELVDTYINAQKAMKLSAYHQAMMSIKHQQAPGSWQASLQSPCHEGINVSQPPMYDQYLNSVGPNVALQSLFNGPKGSYTYDRSPTVPTGIPPNNVNYGLHYGYPPPSLPQSPQLRNPPPTAPMKTKSYRLPP